MTAAVTDGVTPPVTQTWLGVTAAAQAAGVSKRTVRRWIAEGRVVSRLETVEGLELRFVRGDTLTALTGDVTAADTGDPLPGMDSSAPGDVTGADTGAGGDSAIVAVQAAEIVFLRAQLEGRAVEAAELRRLLLVAQQSLAVALEMRALPAAPPRQVRWWWPWRRA